MLQGHGCLLSGLTQLTVALALELEAQQAVNRGGIPGGLQTFEIEGLAQNTDCFMGGRHHGPAQPGGLHHAQQAHRQEGFATAGKPAEHKRDPRGAALQPGREGIGRFALIVREVCGEIPGEGGFGVTHPIA